MSADENDLDRWTRIRTRVARAARAAGRDSSAVRLVCVTKTVAAARVEPILAAGARDFGENRVQEAAGKWPALRAVYPDLSLRLIGPLQTNKAREAVRLFDAIETIDRPRLAAIIAEEMQKLGRKPTLYVQVNIGEEPQKGGVQPSEADAFIRQCREEFGLSVAGLMCIPPADQLASPYFALLREIAFRNGVAGLSMGMTSDFELAIRHGATEVRVGSAIFGSR